MTRWPLSGMPAAPREVGENVEYAIDGTEHSRDQNGNLVTKQEQYQRKLVADRMAELDEMTRAQSARFWNTGHPVELLPFSIPDEVYEKFYNDPMSLTEGECAIIRWHGGIRGVIPPNAVVKPGPPCRAERYAAVHWPDPDVVEKRIRAATRPTGTELSTPKDLFAKAERIGLDKLAPMELYLLGNWFCLGGSEFAQDGDEELDSKEEDDGGRTLGEDPALEHLPGYMVAYEAAVEEDGVNWETVSLASKLYCNVQHIVTLAQPPDFTAE